MMPQLDPPSEENPETDSQTPSQDDKPTLNRLSLRRFFNELGETLILTLAIFTLVRLAVPSFAVEGGSMQPTFNGDGNERVIVNRLEYMVSDPQRGDIVVIQNPDGGEEPYIKRIVGLPGETVSMFEGLVYVDGRLLNEPYIEDFCSSSKCDERTWQLGADEYFILGDNRNGSRDSVEFGPVSRGEIIGRAWINFWPPQDWRIFEHFDYTE